MKKILWMHSHFKFWMGGTKLIYQLTSRINEHIPVKVVVEDYSDYAEKIYAEKNMTLIKTTGVTSTMPLYWANLNHYLRKNREILKKHIDKDTILMSSMFPMNAVLNAFANPKYQYIFEPFAFIHDKDMVSGLPLARRLFCAYVRTFYKQLDISTTQKSDKIFTLNEITSQSIKRIYDCESIPTYTGIDLDFFSPTPNAKLKRAYADRRVLIHATDFTPVKGTDHLLKPLSIVKKKYPNVLLLITSTLDNPKALRELYKKAAAAGVRENIEYLGFLPYRELPEYYTVAEALLQSGIGATAGATSFSLPVKEAMSCGTPVIRHPITQEDVEDGVSGLLIDVQEAEKYADGIIQLLDEPETSARMGRRAREKIVATFNWGSVIDTLLDNMV